MKGLLSMRPKGSYPEEKKSASIWASSKGGGGLTGIQIVRGTIKKVAFFSGKVPLRCPRRQGGAGGQGNFDNV